uniref:Uncharacterized protein n=1 Tax=Candidatus Kentrum sp. LFY TaxID=2126342 RepID=A0A450UA17_9GAMM|nr:MAG: hypothetical protein BECKLFY1418B_GA0070995_100347 [Candidatus Kentron sp. LFY]VFJ88959.1 MAG: hypothetical protein BECKLFY1418A_GA0070994_10067 [Candidatus Kentron sp. LFY]VFK13730.1 MAG: hypothetical protein BECKLFY1418C_GA0070996_100422 [Candidatus Kentron sp. LFY]
MELEPLYRVCRRLQRLKNDGVHEYGKEIFQVRERFDASFR